MKRDVTIVKGKSMKSNCIGKIAAFLTAIIVTALSTLNISAYTPTVYTFDTWYGNGDANVIISDNFTAIGELSYNGEIIDVSYYYYFNNTLTLSESYLKSLDFENGEYTFNISLYKPGSEIYEEAFLSDGKLTFDTQHAKSFKCLLYDGKEVDEADYTVSEEDYCAVIRLDGEDIDEMNYINAFTAIFSCDNIPIELRLKVEIDPSHPSIRPGIEDEEKVYCKSTIDEGFADDCVLVVIKSKYSIVNSVLPKEAFPNVEIESIEDLTHFENEGIIDYYNNFPDFHQILCIKLVNKGKEEVLKAIKEIEKLDFVYSAEPDYYISIDPLPNPPSPPMGHDTTAIIALSIIMTSSSMLCIAAVLRAKRLHSDI